MALLASDTIALRAEMRRVLADIAKDRVRARQEGADLQVTAAATILQDIAIEQNS